MESAWFEFAITTAPRFAVVGFLTGFGLWSAMWLVVRAEGDRTVPLFLSIKIGLGVGLYCAVLVGGAVAALAYPLLFLVPLPPEVHGFLLWIFPIEWILPTEEPNYWWMLGIIVVLLLVPVLGCIWLEAGREPPPSVDLFSPWALREYPAWSYLVADQQLASAFETANRLSSKKVFETFRGFADQGNAAAQNNVGVLFENGFGVERSDCHAEEYYRRAAEQGVRTAQFNLAAALIGDILQAGMTQHRSDTDRRLVEGYKWALIAKAQHYPGISLRHIRKRMHPTHVAEGESMARLWLEQHGVRKQSKLGFLIEQTPRVLRRELASFRM